MQAFPCLRPPLWPASMWSSELLTVPGSALLVPGKRYGRKCVPCLPRKRTALRWPMHRTAMTDAARCVGHRSAVQWHMQRAAFSETEPPPCQAHTACPSPRRPLHPLRKPIFSPKHKAANHEETSWQPLTNPTFRPGQRASATEPAAPKPHFLAQQAQKRPQTLGYSEYYM